MTLLADLDPHLPSAEDEVMAREGEALLRAQVNRLHRRHATALTMRYGLHGEHTSTFSQIGFTLGVTATRARQICQRAERDLHAIVVLDERREAMRTQRRETARH